MVITCKSIPPKEGIAIGITTSAPFPVAVKTGIKAIIAVAAVIIAGRTLFDPACKTDALISLIVFGFSLSNTWVK